MQLLAADIVSYCQLRVRRALMLGKDVQLTTRRALLLYKVFGDSTLLVLSGTLLNSISALLDLNWRYYFLPLFVESKPCFHFKKIKYLETFFKIQVNLRYPKPFKALLPVLAMLKIGFSWVVPQKMNDVYTIPRGGSSGFKGGGGGGKTCVHRAHFESLMVGIQGPPMGPGSLFLDALSFCRIILIQNGMQKQNKT